MRITFDHGPESGREKFESPRDLIVARDAAEVPDALRAMEGRAGRRGPGWPAMPVTSLAMRWTPGLRR